MTTAVNPAATPTVRADILIIGAGPVGLFGAYYAGARGLSVAVVDSLSQLGGQITAMYPEKEIYDVAGFPAVSGRELVAGLVEQAARYDPTYLLGREAQTHEETDDGRHLVGLSDGSTVDAGAVVITGGIGTFTPRALPAGEDFLGRGLDYFVPDSTPFHDANVVVVGGGDSAIDWSLMLAPIARSVTLVHRRDKFRAHQASVDEVLAHQQISVMVNAQVAGLEGGVGIEKAVVETKGAGAGAAPTTTVLECERVVAALGFTANLGPLRDWGLDLHDNRHVVVDSAMRTNLAGVFSAGDITDYDGKVRLIAVGFGEVATAVNNAAVHLDPDAMLFPGHSTDNPR